ncbi:hypothetical protein BUALT_Bualt02G0035600 [Buddleja alternifolia]|uniref:RING-type E3 ubiquitin transferase n=1 Tax=Buddleja alternifolia TaxID=168488 RepID=A0AAV6Y1E7_9LAMI|nr:hypothetical protein BUALT_Bualt02G0035600 [Buddleja alternifolia]
MNPAVILIHRRLLQAAADVDTFGGIPQTPLSAVRTPLNPTTPFDSSMALTIIVLLTALFFLGFFSVYIRRVASSEEPPPPSRAAARRRLPQSTSRKGGLESSAVDSLPVVAYGKAAKHRMIDDCPICLSEFGERESVKLIPYCGHVYHPTCIDTWLASHVTCPLCRSAQLFKEEVCLDVTHDKNDIGATEIGEGSTVGNGDTWTGSGSRAGSCSSLANQAV